MELEYVVESAGGRASRVRVGDHELMFNLPADARGAGGGPGPLAVFVAAAGACQRFFACQVLEQAGVPADDLVVRVHASTAAEGPKRIARLRSEVRLPPGLDAETRRRVEAAILGCPVDGTFKHPPETELVVVAPEDAAAGGGGPGQSAPQ